jgi:hypothetical protein
MRNMLRIVMAAALVAAVSPSVMATVVPPVPDGGATALLVAIGAGGLLAADKFLRKK